MSGKLIMFDGPDGVGKSTQLELVAAALQGKGHQVYVTHLLGGTDIGEALRSVIFSDMPRPPATNLHINLAIYHALAQKAEDERQRGTIVLIDRSPLSLVAYQVYGDGLDADTGYRGCDEGLLAFHPDELIIYEAPFELLEERRAAQRKAADYFDSQPAEYHKRTAEGYKIAADHYLASVIDASDTTDDVLATTMALIEALLTD